MGDVIKDTMSAAMTEGHAELMGRMKAELRAGFRENGEMTGGAFDRSLAVACVNGTFVGRRAQGIVCHRNIPSSAHNRPVP